MCNAIKRIYIDYIEVHDYLRIDFNKFLTITISNNQPIIYSNITLFCRSPYLSEIKTFIKLVTQHFIRLNNFELIKD